MRRRARAEFPLKRRKSVCCADEVLSANEPAKCPTSPDPCSGRLRRRGSCFLLVAGRQALTRARAYKPVRRDLSPASLMLACLLDADGVHGNRSADTVVSPLSFLVPSAIMRSRRCSLRLPREQPAPEWESSDPSPDLGDDNLCRMTFTATRGRAHFRRPAAAAGRPKCSHPHRARVSGSPPCSSSLLLLCEARPLSRFVSLLVVLSPSPPTVRPSAA